MAVRSDEGAGIGVISGGGDFAVEVAAEEAFRISVAEFLAGVVGGGGAGEEEVGVGISKGEGSVRSVDLVEGILEEDGEDGGFFVEADAEDFDAFAAEVANVVGEIAPKAEGFVAVVAADFEAVRGGDVGEDGGLAAGESEKMGKVDSLGVDSGGEIRDEAGIDEAGDVEAVILAGLAPGVAFDDGVAEDLVAALFADGGDGGVGDFGDIGNRGAFGESGRDWVEEGRKSADGVDVFGAGVGFAAEKFELAVIFITVAIYIIFKGIHGFDVVGELGLCSLGADFDEETAAELGEGDGSAVVGLVAARGAEEFFEVFYCEVVPVSDVVAGDDGEDLVLVGVGGDLVKNSF